MIRAPSALFWISFAIIASTIGFYQTNNKVQLLEQKLHGLNASIESQQESLHVLKAEWVYLANPERLEDESRKHLSLGPTAPRQVVRLSDLGSLLPTHEDAIARADLQKTALAAPPAPSLRTRIAAVIAHPAPVHAVKGAMAVAMAVTSVEPSHSSDHVVLARTSATPSKADSIGVLLDELRTHP